jgi:hypothetical protein
VTPLTAVKDAAFKVLSKVLHAIGVALCFLFYWLVVGPYSIVYRLIWRDGFHKEPDPGQPSYWNRISHDGAHPERPY